ncbi:uncharacterized protein LOC133919851 [Phragmites australis]|uniref:uncharacterized protein LOC133919851 n=1 Tax=Phragmites australis TaxID=29695 RepID=UPI002D779B40|nr:uncharacterized protein LOC133919851 [Phragmites australis]
MPGDSVVIRLPDPRALRVVARSVLLAVALLSLPWLRAAEAPARRRARDACGTAAAQAELLVRDMRREGLLAPGARAVVLGADGDCGAPAPKEDEVNTMRPVSLRRMLMIGDSSLDFLLDFGFFDEEGDRFAFADRVLKYGGIIAAPIGSLSVFSLPQNYRIIYISTFAETVVGIKKIAHAGDNGNASTGMELPSPGTTGMELQNPGLLSGQLAESANGEFKNIGRKLLLSDITE